MNSTIKQSIIVLTLITIGYLIPKETVTSHTVIEQKESQEIFSKKLLKKYIKDLRIKYPKVVLRQALLETNTFKSTIFIENKNPFGMKVPERRPTTSIGINRNHSVFSNFRDSVLDYAMFQSRFITKIHSEEEYYAYLDEHYSEIGEKYSKRLKSIPDSQLED